MAGLWLWQTEPCRIVWTELTPLIVRNVATASNLHSVKEFKASETVKALIPTTFKSFL